MKAMRVSFSIISAGCVLLLLIGNSWAEKPDKGKGGGGGGDLASPAYTIVPFAPPSAPTLASGVLDLNEKSEAVGWVEWDDRQVQAVHLDSKTGQYSFLLGDEDSRASGVNNSSQMVGEVGDLAAFWPSPDLPPISLLPLEGHLTATAFGINDAGIVIGASESGPEAPRVPVLWRVFLNADEQWDFEGPYELPGLTGAPESSCADINECVDGVAYITGYSGYGTGEMRAVVWQVQLSGTGLTCTGPVSLGTLELEDSTWSEGIGINNQNEVCGTSDYLPFISVPGEPLEAWEVPRNAYKGNPNAISDVGEAVGYIWFYGKRKSITNLDLRAYIWRSGRAFDLYDEIDATQDWSRLEQATCVNNSGVIGGYGTSDVSQRGFLLKPILP